MLLSMLNGIDDTREDLAESSKCLGDLDVNCKNKKKEKGRAGGLGLNVKAFVIAVGDWSGKPPATDRFAAGGASEERLD